MTKYEKAKARARAMAVDYSYEAGELVQSYAEVAEMGAKFEKLGRRYGLLREFRENGIC